MKTSKRIKSSIMRRWSFFSLSLLLVFVIPTHSSDLIFPQVVDLINSTCKKCSDESAALNYNLCVTSLQAIPVTHVTNLQGIGIVAMELALENATNTISTVEKMLSSKKFDPFAMSCLNDCLELYLDAIDMLADALAAFLSKHFDAANILVRTVMDAAATCEEEFTEKKGEPNPLATENYNLFQLSDISWCIIEQVATAPPDLHTASS